MRKAIWTLNIGNYAPELTEITFPLMRYYARKIGAEFHVITERKFPGFPIPYEKLQIHERGRDYDWNYFLDADAVVHPECIDFTDWINKDTVVHNGTDFAPIRWRMDDYFRRDGRRIGSCNWNTLGSNWCLDLWKPLEIPLYEAVSNIFPTLGEFNSGVIDPEHLLDDYTLSRNIAKHGLKVTTIPKILEDIGLPGAWFFWHIYTEKLQEKVRQMRNVIRLPKAKDKGTVGHDCGWALGDFLQSITDHELTWLKQENSNGTVDGCRRGREICEVEGAACV